MSEITNIAAEKLIRASDARRAILKADPRLAYCIDNIPGVEAEPVVHGRWVFGAANRREYMKCSVCLKSQTPTGVFTYCPNCGAKMDGGNENG